MAAKKSTKKELPKKDTTPTEEKGSVEKKALRQAQDEKKEETSHEDEPMTKDEIKELVEETIDEALKDQKDKEPKEAKEEVTAPTTIPTLGSTQEEEKPVISTEVNNISEKDKESAEDTPSIKKEEPETLSQLQSEKPSIIGSEEKPATIDTTPPQTDINPLTPVVTESETSTPNTQPINTSTSPSQTTPPKKSSHIGIFLFVFFFLVAAGGGFWFLTTSSGAGLLKMLPLRTIIPPASTPTPPPTPTTTEVNVSEYKVAVLNGSGVSGQAAKVKTLLTDAGFSVDTTGNASTSNHTQTTIAAKSSVTPEALTKLSETLAKEYDVATEHLTLTTSASEDIIITVGKPR